MPKSSKKRAITTSKSKKPGLGLGHPQILAKRQLRRRSARSSPVLCALDAAEKTTLQKLISSPSTVTMPSNWTAEDVRDAIALATQFDKTFRNGNATDNLYSASKVKVLLLQRSHLNDAYEQFAKEFESTQVPLLDRKSAGPPSVERRSDDASSVGLVFEKLGFHGTYNDYIAPICNDGFLQPTSGGYHGNAIYTAHESQYSRNYAKGDRRPTKSRLRQMLGCRVLAFAGELFDFMYAVVEPKRVLPLVVFQYFFY